METQNSLERALEKSYMTNLQKQDRNDFYLSEKQEVVSLLPAEVIEWGFVSSFSVTRDI